MRNEPIRGILLDLDETLHSRERAFGSWLDTEARRAGVSLDGERSRIAELDARGRGDKPALLEHLSRVLGWGGSAESHLERFREGIVEHVALEPGARDLLLRVRREHRLGLVSNGTGRTQRAKLTRLGIADPLDPIVISEEVGVRKPDARIFQIALSNWSLPRESVVFVGDDPVADVQGALDAGLRALRIGEGGIPSILDLEAWLEARRTPGSAAPR